jgi:lipopolysaccharide biosynthesis glycosyltransferase
LLSQFEQSYRQLRRYYSGSVSLVTDLDVGGDGFRVVRSPSLHEGFGAKTQLFDLIEDDKVLFLDCDVMAIRPFDEVWGMIDQDHFLIAKDVNDPLWRAVEIDAVSKRWPGRWMSPVLRYLGPNHPYYNTGVFAWKRTEHICGLFRMWELEWKRFRGSSQYPLVMAMDWRGERPGILPPKYNSWSKWYQNKQQALDAGVTFMHCWSEEKNRMSDFEG